MKNNKSRLTSLVCTALLATTFITPSYFYANDASDINDASDVNNTNVEETTQETDNPAEMENLSEADLAQVKAEATRTINIDEFGDLPTKEKYLKRIESATTVADVNNILAEFNKEKQNAIRAEFEKKSSKQFIVHVQRQDFC